MKKFTHRSWLKACVVALAIAMTAALTACGGSTKGAGKMTKCYRAANYHVIDAMSWGHTNEYELELNDDDTYRLVVHNYRFGLEDFANRGLRTIIYWGTYTSAPSADEETSHLDVKLAAATRIYLDQQDKAFSRTTDFPSGNLTLDTDAWTDAMSQLYLKEDGANGAAADFLAQYAHELEITVEDPSLLPEDTTLSYRLVTIPDLSNGVTDEMTLGF